jgi:riboflavin biosynthesis pyrimidine reductase
MVQALDGAATLDGRTAPLGSEADKRVFDLLRALADVILVGAGTARTEGYEPVRPESEGLRWAWLRDGRTPSAPIAVVTRALDLDLASPLIAGSPPHARTIVITTQAAPPERRAAAARTADVIVAGAASVDMKAALDALAERGHLRILTEGGPVLLAQLVAADLLDELCLTLSPLLAGSAAGRIVAGALMPGGGAHSCTLAHVLADDNDHLLCRYLRQGHPGSRPGRS